MTVDELRAQIAVDTAAMAEWRARHEAYVAKSTEARNRGDHLATQRFALLADATACRVSGLRQCIARLEAVLEASDV